METYTIKIGSLEALYLSDAISMFQHGPPMAGVDFSAFPDLLVKVGACVLYTEEHKGIETGLGLTVEELWMVREVAKSSVVVGSERVGLKLLVKAYGELMKVFPEHLISDSAGPELIDVNNILGDLLNGPTKEYEA